MNLPLDQYTLKELRDDGYLVVLWSPGELKGLHPVEIKHLEDQVIEQGSTTLELLREEKLT